MVVILVVVPDSLERWLSLEIARVVGWAVACAVWVVAVERHWQQRVGPVRALLPPAGALGQRGAGRDLDQRSGEGGP